MRALLVLALVLLTSAPYQSQAAGTGPLLEPTGSMSSVSDGLDAYLVGGRSVGPSADVLLYHEGALAKVGSLPTPRWSTSAAWVGPHIYIFGGNDGSLLDEILRFDVENRTMITLHSRLPSARDGTAAVSDGTYAYIFGGRSDRLLDEIVRFDPRTGEVRVLDARLDSPLADASASWNGTTIFVFGGQGRMPLSTIYAFDPASGNAVLHATSLPVALSHTAAAWDGRVILVIGGKGATLSRAIWEFDPTKEEISPSRHSLNSPLYGATAAITLQGLTVFGGFSQAARDDVQTFNTWMAPPAPIPELGSVALVTMGLMLVLLTLWRRAHRR